MKMTAISVAKTFTLNNGYCIPAVGLGTSTIKNDEMEHVIKTALYVGYRHFDSACVYSNNAVLERVLSDVLSSGKIKRDEIFITSKLGVHASRPEDVTTCIIECLENLKMNYVDLFLIHQPIGVKEPFVVCVCDGRKVARQKLSYVSKTKLTLLKIFKMREAKTIGFGKDYHLYLDPTTDYLGIWKEMEQLVHSGYTKSIGVSNFNKKPLAEISQICTIKPVINQIECHPYLQEKELLQFCTENDIIMEAYGAIGSLTINKFYEDTFGCDFSRDEVIGTIAKRHKRSIAQILLRYQVQRGVVVLPKSSHAGRLKDNINIFDFSLSPIEIGEISNLDRAKRIFHQDYARNHPNYPR